MKSVPSLEERIMTGSEEEVTIIADLVSKDLTVTTPCYLNLLSV